LAQEFTSEKYTSIADQVVGWLMLLRSGRASQADYADFLEWRAADPMHESTWRQMTSRTVASPARRRFLAGGAALAGAGALGVAGLDRVYPLRNLGADAATGTADRRTYILQDGSRLLLDARSRARLLIGPGQRKVHLLAGAIAVSATPDDERPFTVSTGQGTISTTGGRYMVRQETYRSLVATREGHVEIETDVGSRSRLGPGYGARFDNARIDMPRKDLLADAAWETGWVDVRQRPLMDVVAALRPYRKGLLRVSVPAGGLLVTGRFPLDDTDAALAALEDSMPIRVDRYTPLFVSIDLASA
jgi:transmembrane sensor